MLHRFTKLVSEYIEPHPFFHHGKRLLRHHPSECHAVDWRTTRPRLGTPEGRVGEMPLFGPRGIPEAAGKQGKTTAGEAVPRVGPQGSRVGRVVPRVGEGVRVGEGLPTNVNHRATRLQCHASQIYLACIHTYHPETHAGPSFRSSGIVCAATHAVLMAHIQPTA